MTLLEEALANARENFGFNRHSKDQHEKLKYVLSLKGAARWRAAAEFYLYLNPVSLKIDPETGALVKTEDARQINRHILAAVAEMRRDNELSGNKFASSTKDKDSGRRHALSMPQGMLKFIEMIDPDVLQGTPQERRDSVHALMRAFPEYCVSPLI